VRRQTAGIAHEVDARQVHNRGQLFQEFQRRQFTAGRTGRLWFCEHVHEISIGIFLKTFSG
jgi:hypothetical protein